MIYVTANIVKTRWVCKRSAVLRKSVKGFCEAPFIIAFFFRMWVLCLLRNCQGAGQGVATWRKTPHLSTSSCLPKTMEKFLQDTGYMLQYISHDFQLFKTLHVHTCQDAYSYRVSKKYNFAPDIWILIDFYLQAKCADIGHFPRYRHQAWDSHAY